MPLENFLLENFDFCKVLYTYIMGSILVALLLLYVFFSLSLSFVLIVFLVFIVLLYYSIDYYISLWGIKFSQKQALKWTRERISAGKKPYVSPWVLAIMMGIIFDLISLSVLTYMKKPVFSTSNVEVFVLAFILGAIFGYFTQKRNIKSIEG